MRNRIIGRNYLQHRRKLESWMPNDKTAKVRTSGGIMDRPTTVSLFCGAGGETAGKELAFEALGISTTNMLSHAVNHWDAAVATHGANYLNRP